MMGKILGSTSSERKKASLRGGSVWDAVNICTMIRCPVASLKQLLQPMKNLWQLYLRDV
jgi:hypothetical protein